MDSFQRLIEGLVRIYGTEERLAEVLGVPVEVVRCLPMLQVSLGDDITAKFAKVLGHVHPRPRSPWDDELPYTRDPTRWEAARAHVYSTGAADTGRQFSPRRSGAEFMTGSPSPTREAS